jgi:hypothetical protein
MDRRHVLLLAASLLPASATLAGASGTGLSASEFEGLLQRLANAWNSGNTRAAADCFSEDAVYVEPPQKQVYRGRQALYRFFGGEAGRPGAMDMTWRNVVFDAGKQRGMGEFTFRYGTQVHGVAVISVRDGLIAQWREYWYASEQPFDEFVAPGSR